jgi:hypothetical protein
MISNKVDEFLEKHVLSNEAAVQALQRWTSITKSDYLSRITCKRHFRVPDIWMLTGLYQMEDARAYRTTEMIDGCTWVGAKIWAAQYQLLRLRYRFVRSEEALPELTLPLQMRNVYTSGGFLGSDSDSDDDENRADNAVTVEGCVDMEATEIDVDHDYAGFFEAFNDTEKRWDETDELNALLSASD